MPCTDAILAPTHKPRLILSIQEERSVLLPEVGRRKPTRLEHALVVAVVSWVLFASLVGCVALGLALGAVL